MSFIITCYLISISNVKVLMKTILHYLLAKKDVYLWCSYVSILIIINFHRIFPLKVIASV